MLTGWFYMKLKDKLSRIGTLLTGNNIFLFLFFTTEQKKNVALYKELHSVLGFHSLKGL